MKRYGYITLSLLPLVAIALGLLLLTAGCQKKSEEAPTTDTVMDESDEVEVDEVVEGAGGAVDAVVEEAAPEVAEMVKFANVRCPIMGTELDLANVPEDLQRTYKGQKVAFCCAGCPSKWDALSDEEKAEKLAAVAAPE